MSEQRKTGSEQQDQGILPQINLTAQQAVVGGSALLTSLLVDAAVHFDPMVMVGGAITSYALGKYGPEVANLLIPGSNPEAVKEGTAKVVNAIAPQRIDYSDQSALAKIKRLVGIKTYAPAKPKEAVDERKEFPTEVKNETAQSKNETSGFCDSGPADEILDLGYVLQSRLPFKLHANRLFGEGLFVAGNQGAGKSMMLARLVEQFAKCGIPCMVFDLKPEFYTIPRLYSSAIRAGHPNHAEEAGGSYYSVTLDNVDEFIADIMAGGFQVIVDLPSYEDVDAQGEIIAAIVDGLMRWARELPEDQRFPYFVLLDEAHYFLPQQIDLVPLSKETAEKLNKAFSKIVNMGRSYGYTMGFFTQRIANIKKWVIANCQVKVIMKHGLDVDLKRCEEEVKREVATREDIERLGKGQGIVIGWGVKPFIVQFSKRESHHPSSTPDIKRARAFYAGDTTQTRIVRTEKPIQVTRSPFYPQTGALQQIDQESTRVQIPEQVAQQTYHRSTPILPANLQQTLDVYVPGMSYRDLGKALGIGKDAAGERIQELKRRKLI